MTLTQFPPLNATLNGLSGILVVGGLIAIKKGRIRTHVAMMIAALCSSTAFLVCYLIYHALRAHYGAGMTRFPLHNRWRTAYLVILWTHTPLAAIIVPLVAGTVWLAYRRHWSRHRKLASITYPLWLYVSVTGVIIYLMLLNSGAYLAQP